MAHLVLPNGKGHGWKPDTFDPNDSPLSKVVHRKAIAAIQSTRPQIWLDPALLSKTRDQGQQGSCHDDQTDVLTQSGWVRFAALTGDEALATVDPATRKMSFERPVSLTRYHYVGPMICVRGRANDFKVTPNHVMLVRKWDERKRSLAPDFVRVRADQLGWYSGLMASCTVVQHGEDQYELPARPEANLKGQRIARRVSMATWLRFLGIYLAEGTICRRAARAGRIEDEWKVQIAGAKPRERQFIHETLEALGVVALPLKDRFTFHNMQIIQALWDLGLGGVKAGVKFVPEFVFKQSAANIREFLLGHFMGDGYMARQNVMHSTSSYRLADGLHALAFMAGSNASLTIRNVRAASMMADGRTITGRLPEHRVGLRTREDGCIERKTVFEELYAGEVFCAEVPTHHTLVTRRNGRVLVSGNCTGHGTVDALEWSFRFKHKKDLTLSPADAYLGGRIIEASIKEDSGCEIRDVIKAGAKDGVCLNRYMPYSDQKLATKRTKTSIRNARAHQVGVGYYRCDDNGTNREVTVDNMIRALDSNMPVVGGYSWLSCLDTSTFEQTGVMPAPFGKLEGGHCNNCVGVDIAGRMFLWHNSYGDGYGAKHPTSGQGGFIVMPFTWVLSGACDDCWAVRHE